MIDMSGRQDHTTRFCSKVPVTMGDQGKEQRFNSILNCFFTFNKEREGVL